MVNGKETAVDITIMTEMLAGICNWEVKKKIVQQEVITTQFTQILE